MKRVRCGLLAVAISVSALGCHNETPLGPADETVQVENLDQAVALAPGQTPLQEAEAALKDENWGRALELATRALQKDAGNPAFLLIRAEAYDGNNELEKALVDYDEVLKADTKNARALRDRANIYYDFDRIDEAIADIQASLALEPKNARDHSSLAALWNEQDKVAHSSKMLAEFDESVRLDPNQVDAYFCRFGYYLGAGNIEKASEYLAKLKELNSPDDSFKIANGAYLLATNQPEKARELFETLTHSPLSHSRRQGHRGLAKYYLDIAKDLDRALPEIEKALALRTNASLIFTRGKIYYSRDAYAKAAADFTEYLRLNPRGNKEVFSVRGECFRWGLGRHLEAIDDFTRSLNLDRELLVAHHARASTHFSLLHYRDALQDYNECVLRQPDSTEFLQRRAFCHSYCDRDDLALEDLAKSFELCADESDRRLLFYNRAACLISLNRFQEALADYKKAETMKPLNPEERYSVAYALYKTGQIETAVNHLSEMIQLPTYFEPEFRAARGACLAKLGRHAEAAADFAQAKQLARDNRESIKSLDAAICRNPKNVMAYVARARLQHDAKEIERTIADCTQALEIDPKCWYALAIRAAALAEREPDRAIADCNRGMELNLSWIDFRSSRALAYQQKGNHAQALQDFTEAIRRRPELGRLYQWRARSLQALDEMAKAADDRAKAIELGEMSFEIPTDLAPYESCVNIALVQSVEAPPALNLLAAALDLPPAPVVGRAAAAITPPTQSSPLSLLTDLAPIGTKKEEKSKLLWDDLPVTTLALPLNAPPPLDLPPSLVASSLPLPPGSAGPKEPTANSSPAAVAAAANSGRLMVGDYVEIDDAADQARWDFTLTVQEVTPNALFIRGKNGWLAFALYDADKKEYRGFFEWQEFGASRSPEGKWADLYQIRLVVQNGVLRMEGKSRENEILIRAKAQKSFLSDLPASAPARPLEAPPPASILSVP